MTPPDLSRRPRTTRVLSDADMERMRDLYYDRSLPLPRVGDAFGVPASTLLRCIGEMDWPKRSAYVPASTSPALAPHASPAPCPLPVNGEREPDAPSSDSVLVDIEAVAYEIAATARLDLQALMGESGYANMSLAVRRRRAEIINTLSRAIARLDKSLEMRARTRVLRERIAEYEAREEAAEWAPLNAIQNEIAERLRRVAQKMGRG